MLDSGTGELHCYDKEKGQNLYRGNMNTRTGECMKVEKEARGKIEKGKQHW